MDGQGAPARLHYADIDGWFYHEVLFEGLLREMPDGSTIVEVGSWKGQSAVFIAGLIEDRGGRLWCVDHWLGSDEAAHRSDPDVQAGTLYETFRANTRGYDCITPLRMSSVDAAQRFEDESLYLVYLDAGHETADVVADIRAWWPKVAPGGWLVGDDWSWPTVRAAVEQEFGDCVVAVGPYPAWVTRKGQAG